MTQSKPPAARPHCRLGTGTRLDAAPMGGGAAGPSEHGDGPGSRASSKDTHSTPVTRLAPPDRPIYLLQYFPSYKHTASEQLTPRRLADRRPGRPGGASRTLEPGRRQVTGCSGPPCGILSPLEAHSCGVQGGAQHTGGVTPGSGEAAVRFLVAGAHSPIGLQATGWERDGRTTTCQACCARRARPGGKQGCLHAPPHKEMTETTVG